MRVIIHPKIASAPFLTSDLHKKGGNKTSSNLYVFMCPHILAFELVVEIQQQLKR